MSVKLLIFSVILLTILGIILSAKLFVGNDSSQNQDLVCTQDAKTCPDGSSVGRVPPKCEFAPCSGQNQSLNVSIIADNLEIPWGLAFLPDRSILFTERPGRVRLIDKEGKLQSSPVATITGVKHTGEGGLLGIAVHPDFISNSLIYLYYTYSSSGSSTLNKVTEFKLENGRLINERIVVDNIPGSSNHNGGRIKFGPDKLLYIATGDGENPSRAQDRNFPAGKILRVGSDGSVEVYSFGHRNPQGLAWDSQGRLWATEHGRSGFDELNLIKQGANYGWPTIQGDESRFGMESPVINSGNDTWAPAGAAYFEGSIFFGGLRGETLYQAVTLDNKPTIKEHFKGRFGRIRDVVLGPDNFLYIATGNRDGRGEVQDGDDKIIKLDPKEL